MAWVGVLRQPKRPDLLIEIAEQSPGVEFVVCGGPSGHRSPPEYSETIIQRLQKVPNIRYLGHVAPARAIEVIGSAALLLSTSDAEGFPSVFVEAWAHGTPVVTLKIDPDQVIAQNGLGAVSGGVERSRKRDRPSRRRTGTAAGDGGAVPRLRGHAPFGGRGDADRRTGSGRPLGPGVEARSKPRAPMKVLVLHSELGVLWGGGETFTTSLFQAVARRGHHVTAVFVADRRGQYPRALAGCVRDFTSTGYLVAQTRTVGTLDDWRETPTGTEAGVGTGARGHLLAHGAVAQPPVSAAGGGRIGVALG